LFCMRQITHPAYSHKCPEWAKTRA
jgi:hypothetical protein